LRRIKTSVTEDNGTGIVFSQKMKAKKSTLDIDKYLTDVAAGEGIIEGPIPRLMIQYAEILNTYYEERESERHFSKNESVNSTKGLIAELCFENVLTEIWIPSLHNSLTLKANQLRSDFWIPGLDKTIDVKLITEFDEPCLLETVERWRDNPADFVVGMRLLPLGAEPEQLKNYKIAGYLTRAEVESRSTQPFPSGECYYTPISELRPWAEFFKIMMEKAVRPANAPNVA